MFYVQPNLPLIAHYMVFASDVLIIFWYNGLINNLSMSILLKNFHLHSSFDIE